MLSERPSLADQLNLMSGNTTQRRGCQSCARADKGKKRLEASYGPLELSLNRLREMRIVDDRVHRHLGRKLLVKVRGINRARLQSRIKTLDQYLTQAPHLDRSTRADSPQPA